MMRRDLGSPYRGCGGRLNQTRKHSEALKVSDTHCIQHPAEYWFPMAFSPERFVSKMRPRNRLGAPIPAHQPSAIALATEALPTRSSVPVGDACHDMGMQRDAR
jgi:hypothetical protein